MRAKVWYYGVNVVYKIQFCTATTDRPCDSVDFDYLLHVRLMYGFFNLFTLFNSFSSFCIEEGPVVETFTLRFEIYILFYWYEYINLLITSSLVNWPYIRDILFLHTSAIFNLFEFHFVIRRFTKIFNYFHLYAFILSLFTRGLRAL